MRKVVRRRDPKQLFFQKVSKIFVSYSLLDVPKTVNRFYRPGFKENRLEVAYECRLQKIEDT